MDTAATTSEPNRLYFGDCLEVMRRDIDSESVDLVYLDPPFNSKRLYNAFIKGAQWVAFNDTWQWHRAVDDFHEVAIQPRFASMMEGLRMMLGEDSQLAYLSYMANRLIECHRVLKRTGNIYLHCDPTMSHYLKLVMDSIFGMGNFRNEIVWRYKKYQKANMGYFTRNSDRVLYYRRSSSSTYNPVFEQLKAPKRYLKRRWDKDTQRIVNAKDEKGRVQYISVDQEKIDDVWELPYLMPAARERIGYPTQKPLALLERIIRASSKEGDRVLDPFCGCGTTIHAAQNLGRRWTGIDICVNACRIIEGRVKSHFDSLWDDIEFIGIPKTAADAKTLASLDPFRFERWGAALVDGMEANIRQRGDKGIDGWGRIPIRKGHFIDVVSQIKGGATGPGHVQAFNGARQQAGADLGIFTCFSERVTPRMRDAAASTGRFMDVPTVQIYTIEDYFEGRRPLMPTAV